MQFIKSSLISVTFMNKTKKTRPKAATKLRSDLSISFLILMDHRILSPNVTQYLGLKCQPSLNMRKLLAQESKLLISS